MNIYILPTLNACLNTLATGFLILGFVAIRKGQQQKHKYYMLCAFATSIAFLGSYLTYHFLVPGVTRYQGEGIGRVIYFFILATHTPLAAIVLPLAVTAIWYALKLNFKRHTRITRWLFPVWLYVSITGVLIYLMLYVI